MKVRSLIGVRQRADIAMSVLTNIRVWDPRDLGRVVNAVACLTSLRRVHNHGQPFFAQIEPTTACNLRCRFCLNSVVPGPRKMMSLDAFRGILDAMPSLLAVNMQGCTR